MKKFILYAEYPGISSSIWFYKLNRIIKRAARIWCIYLLRECILEPDNTKIIDILVVISRKWFIYMKCKCILELNIILYEFE